MSRFEVEFGPIRGGGGLTVLYIGHLRGLGTTTTISFFALRKNTNVPGKKLGFFLCEYIKFFGFNKKYKILALTDC